MRYKQKEQLQQIAEAALELFGAEFLAAIHAGGTTADVVCEWLGILAAIRKAVKPMMRGQRMQLHLFGENGEGI